MKRYLSKRVVCGAVVVFFVWMITGCVPYQEGGLTINERVAVLEERLAESESVRETLLARFEEIKNKNQEVRDKNAEFQAQINRIQDDIQILRGKIEETEFFLKRKMDTYRNSDKNHQKLVEKIYELTNKNKDHIIRLEQYLNFETTEDYIKVKTGSVSAATEEGGQGTKKELSEEELYKQAKYDFDNSRFEAAREGFQKFIKLYPKSSNADNAQFWIGEIYYREKWYEKAILEYQKVIEQFPKGNKVKASLLKQGFSFYNLQDKPNARLILQELINKYPKSNEAAIARKKLEGF